MVARSQHIFAVSRDKLLKKSWIWQKSYWYFEGEVHPRLKLTSLDEVWQPKSRFSRSPTINPVNGRISFTFTPILHISGWNDVPPFYLRFWNLSSVRRSHTRCRCCAFQTRRKSTPNGKRSNDLPPTGECSSFLSDVPVLLAC